MAERTVNKHHQFVIALFSICLVFVLGLSTANKTIHDSLFHADTLSHHETIDSGCSGHHEGECDEGESKNHTEGESHNHSETCESLSCPVNLFSQGTLTLEHVSAINPIPAERCENISECYISHHTEEEKKSHLVRGPPEKKQV